MRTRIKSSTRVCSAVQSGRFRDNADELALALRYRESHLLAANELSERQIVLYVVGNEYPAGS